jgi:hypothetical protein
MDFSSLGLVIHGAYKTNVMEVDHMGLKRNWRNNIKTKLKEIHYDDNVTEWTQDGSQ